MMGTHFKGFERVGRVLNRGGMVRQVAQLADRRWTHAQQAADFTGTINRSWLNALYLEKIEKLLFGSRPEVEIRLGVLNRRQAG